jgi:hypothetical protein
MAEFKDLVGVTLARVIGEVGGEQIDFEAEDGRTWRMFHAQDCCEHVLVEDICGDLSDLVGSPIVSAEESTSENVNPEGIKPPEYPRDDSFTWTFYRIATAKGLVVIRWYGDSNGYYSESVDFDLV